MLETDEEVRIRKVSVDLETFVTHSMAHFGWSLIGRVEEPYRGSLLHERMIAGAPVSEGEPRRIVTLRFSRRVPRSVRESLAKHESAFWSPSPFPAWLPVLQSVLEWLKWSLAILTVPAFAAVFLDGPREARIAVLWVWTAPMGILSFLTWSIAGLLRRGVAVRQADPSWMAARVRDTQAESLRMAAAELRQHAGCPSPS